jgi:hypothetical protein
VRRVIVRADGVQGLTPGGQVLPRLRVEVAAGRLVPGGQLVAVELDCGSVGPPDLVVGVARR